PWSSRNSCPIRSSSSVVMPGATCRPTSSRAIPAIRPAARIRSTVSASLGCGSSRSQGAPVAWPLLSAYSGAMTDGAPSIGEIRPGRIAARVLVPVLMSYLDHHRHQHRTAPIGLVHPAAHRAPDDVRQRLGVPYPIDHRLLDDTDQLYPDRLQSLGIVGETACGQLRSVYHLAGGQVHRDQDRDETLLA